MFGRLPLAWSLALALTTLAAPRGAAAQTPEPDPPTDTPAPAPPAEVPPTTPDEVPSPADPAPPAESAAPTELTDEAPPTAAPEPAPTRTTADPFTAAASTESPAAAPAPTLTAPPPPSSPPPARSQPPASASVRKTAPPSATAPAPETAPTPGKRESLREATRRRTEADRQQRFRHGGFIIDARVGGTGCLRSVCQGAMGHRASPGLHLGGFVGFNLFGLVELGIGGGWNNLRPRGVAGRNAIALYGIDPAQLQQALAADQDLPLPPIEFTGLDVNSANSRAFDVGPSLRIHLLRKGRGLLFVGAGVHYQLWRNRYATPGGPLRVDVHGASLPLRVGGGVFIHRNLALMAEVAYAPAFFAGMSLHQGATAGVAPFTIIEDITGIKLGRGLPHFWTAALTLRFRLGA